MCQRANDLFASLKVDCSSKPPTYLGRLAIRRDESTLAI